MKAKFAYILLILGILVLVGAGAVMTRSLFDISVEDTEIAPVEKPPTPTRHRRTTPVAEKIIEIGEPEPVASVPPTPAMEAAPRPSARKRAQQARAAAVPASSLQNAQQEPKPRQRVPAPKITRKSSSPSQPTAPRADTDAAGIGRVLVLKGAAHATNPQGTRRLLARDSWVFLNDRIDTGAGVRLTIKFLDGSTISQGENTTILVDKYVYDPENCDKSCFAVRFVRGVCRVITGVIANLNPNRFEVRTRMATVGIRGCDLAFRASPERDDIYVIDLAGKKLVRINTTSDGRNMINVLTGDALDVDEAKRTVIDITEPNSAIFITRGKGVNRAPVTLEDIRRISAETSLLAPARSELLQAPDGAVFVVRPENSASPQSDQAK